jgi:NADP-dependent 3-hydroxy acid dehydrogenase YdfG
MKIFLTGGSSGIGKATQDLLVTQGYQVYAPSRQELDMTDFEKINSLDLSVYDVLINCAGDNRGAYQGWHNNSWQNQKNHVDVNFTAPLFLAKQYTQQRKTGQFIYVSSTSADDPITYTIFMVGSKLALRQSINAVKRDYPDFLFTEVVPGKTRTNMLRQNYQGTKTDQQITHEYAKNPVLDPNQVANAILLSIKLGLDRVGISPRPDFQNNY